MLRSLLEEAIEEDLEAITTELEALAPESPGRVRGTPKRVALPKDLPRIDIRQEPDSTIRPARCRSSGTSAASGPASVARR
jgi:transposase